MILSDKDIAYCAGGGMITPFLPRQVRASAIVGDTDQRRISYGCSTAGYDLRLDPAHGLHYFQRPEVLDPSLQQAVVDPKQFNPEFLTSLRLLHDINNDQQWWELPAYAYAMGLSLETFNIPRDIVGVTLGKSTYARCGLTVNVTPAEPEWWGRLVVEMFNGLPMPVRVYANEGIAQMQFHRLSSDPIESYGDRAGKYQGQSGIVYAKV